MHDRGLLTRILVQPVRSMVGLVRRAGGATKTAFRPAVRTTPLRVISAGVAVILVLALWVVLLLFLPTYLSGELEMQIGGWHWTPEPSWVGVMGASPGIAVVYVVGAVLLFGSRESLRQTSLSPRVLHVIKYLLIAAGFVVFLTAIAAGILANDRWANGDASWRQSVRHLGWETLDAIPLLELSKTFELSEPLPASGLSLTSRVILLLFRIMVLFVAAGGVVGAWSSSLHPVPAPAGPDQPRPIASPARHDAAAEA